MTAPYPHALLVPVSQEESPMTTCPRSLRPTQDEV